MVQILDLPLDKEEPVPERKASSKQSKYRISDDNIELANPNEDEPSDQSMNLKLGNSNDSSDFFSVDYNNRNQFLETKEVLQQIFVMENNNPEFRDALLAKSKGEYLAAFKLLIFKFSFTCQRGIDGWVPQTKIKNLE